ncbi:MAG: hypothetical protein HY262_14205 [Chloroflexi bacterium]|nr:hypothetical protein [Chloroflexota bacterium]
MAGTTVLAFAPGPGTGNNSPFNAADAKPSPVPCAPTLANLPAPGGSSADYTCAETGGSQSVTVSYFPDTPSGTATDNAWGQGTSSDCYLAKAGGGSPACVTTVFGIGASKTDLQDLGIGLASAAVTGGASHDFFYAGIKRLQTNSTNSSNANYSVEINQLLPAYQPAAPICDGTVIVGGGCNMWRSPGDITLMTDWGGNSSSCGDPTPAICAYVWIDFASGIGANGATRTPSPAGSTCFNAKAAPCWGILPGGSAKLGDITNSDKAAGSIDAATSTFSEIGVDLNAAGLEAPGQCLIARRFWAHSRASSSFSAELKDFIVANKTVSTCTGTTTSLHETTAAGADVTPANSGTTITIKTGAYVTDVATVTPSTSSGTVTFKYYTTPDCSDAGTTAGSGIAISGTPRTASSTPVQFSSPGTFYWRAFFTGGPGSSDSSSTCGDEILTVRQDTTTSTVLHETNSAGADLNPANNGTSITVNPGAYVTDVASVLPSGATGTMAFVYYTTSDCSDAGTGAGSGIAVVGGNASSTTVQFSSSGTIYWRAFFTGSGLYNDSSSTCGGEVLTVNQVNTAISTAPWYYPNDKATISSPNGGGNLAGAIVFKLYNTSTNCGLNGATGLLYSEPSQTVSGAGPLDFSTANTSVKVSTTTTVFWRVEFHSTNPAQVGRNSFCQESIAGTLTGDSPGTAGNTTP